MKPVHTCRMHVNLNHEIENIISGKIEVRHGTIIQTIANYLRNCKSSSRIDQVSKQIKAEEATHIERFVTSNALWVEVDLSTYVAEGAEQKVYLEPPNFVLKANDAIYYNSWFEYLLNLLLHNYFFADTAYELQGFLKHKQILYAVVKQNFVQSSEPTELDNVRTFLEHNGFKKIKNNDYLHIDLQILLEDLHDENVLTQQGLLYFIDTVFYTSLDESAKSKIIQI